MIFMIILPSVRITVPQCRSERTHQPPGIAHLLSQGVMIAIVLRLRVPTLGSPSRIIAHPLRQV